MNAAAPVFTNAPVRHRHAVAHLPVPKVVTPAANDAVKATVKAPSLTPGQFLNKTA